jgi:hypothetical protein
LLSKQDSPIQREQYPCGYTYLAKKKAQGLKAPTFRRFISILSL